MDIEAFILVGGRSVRFGRDKATFQFEGATLAERTAETIKIALSPTYTRLVAANDSQLSGPSPLASGLPVVFDLSDGRGPVGGLQAALAYARTEWALVLGCDFPFISIELLRCLATLITEDFDAVAPVQPDGQTQPLCTFYRVKPCLNVINDIFDQGRPAPALKYILDQVRTRFVRFEELADLPNSANLFLNLNTPEDFKNAVKILSGT